MNLQKLLLVQIFTLTFVFNVFGQQYSYPNELKGYEFFKKGKWKTLIPFVSTKADVEKIFGQDCQNGCDYDENWRIDIQFIEQSWAGSANGAIPCAPEEFLGRYEGISFHPKKQIKKNQFRFGKAFVGGHSTKTYDSSVPDSEYYNDDFGLVFEFYIETGEEKSFRKGNLVAIHYGESSKDYEKYRHKFSC